MPDLEERLTASLRRGAEGAAVPLDLAGGARRRARARRRRRVVTVAVAAACCLAVPAGVVLAHDVGDVGDGGPAARPDSRPAALPAADAGFRWESWRGVSVEVPQGWGTGSLASWCATGGSPSPRVARPGAAGGDAGCAPALSYGLSFSPSPAQGIDWPVASQHNDDYPAGAYVGAREVGGVLVEVATPDAGLSQRVLDSATRRSEFLVGGCPSTSTAPVTAEEVGFVAVCGYGTGGHLVGSRTLDLTDSTTVRAAVQGAPVTTAPGCPPQPAGGLVRLLAADLDATVDLARGCLYVGADHEQRALPDAVRGLSGSQ